MDKAMIETVHNKMREKGDVDEGIKDGTERKMSITKEAKTVRGGV